MRHQTREYLTDFFKRKRKRRWEILDVGSRDEGSGNIRDICELHGNYTGLDMIHGNNVDIVMNAHDMSKLKKEYDLVICVDTFEHDDAFWESIKEIKRVTKSRGWIFLGFPSRGCPEHNHPHDYWRFMPQSMDLFLRGLKYKKVIIDRAVNNETMEDEVYGWGQKV